MRVETTDRCEEDLPARAQGVALADHLGNLLELIANPSARGDGLQYGIIMERVRIGERLLNQGAAAANQSGRGVSLNVNRQELVDRASIAGAGEAQDLIERRRRG